MAELIRASFREHQQAVDEAMKHVELLREIADCIIACFNTGGRLYLLGNGGSAADAQHIAAELVGRFKHHRKALPAVALTTDTSILTAVTNDLGGEYCFSRQVEALVAERDTVWALSVSGASPNVLAAMRTARRVGAMTIGFTGKGGRRLEALCDFCFRVAHDSSDRVQEVHQLAYHIICARIERMFLSTTL